MSATESLVYQEMLDRLYAAVTTGPGLNCRPHNSRQRVDLAMLARIAGTEPQAIVEQLLDGKAVKLSIKPPSGPDLFSPGDELSEDQKVEKARAEELKRLLSKLRAIAEDSKTYEQDTGAHVLYIGLPVVIVPPGRTQRGTGSSKKVAAPIALVGVNMTVTRGRSNIVVELEASGTGADLVIPNPALQAWLDQISGKSSEELFADEEGKEPYREINELAAHVCKVLELPAPPPLNFATLLTAIPRPDDAKDAEARVLPAAVLGIFPLSNQSLIHDTEAMLAGEAVTKPVEQFVKIDKSHPPAAPTAPGAPIKKKRIMAEERFVTNADPCQARAVRAARSTEMLAVHGPPGTGKSQTIANMIGDHLARGERVLLVCDKRTAIDVVHNRLTGIGLGDLCAVVHNAQTDQRDLYMGIREQLEKLAETKTDPSAEARLQAVDKEQQKLHDELSAFAQALFERPDNGRDESFHELIGDWLDCNTTFKCTDDGIKSVRLSDSVEHEKDVREILRRGIDGHYATNPWADHPYASSPVPPLAKNAAGISLDAYLQHNPQEWRERVAALPGAAAKHDASLTRGMHPFPLTGGATAIGPERVAFGEKADAFFTLDGATKRVRHFAKRNDSDTADIQNEMAAMAADIEKVRAEKLDAELLRIQRDAPIQLAVVLQRIAALDDYLADAKKWFGFFLFKKKTAVTEALKPYGLSLTPENATRLRTFLVGAKTRLMLESFYRDNLAGELQEPSLNDAALLKAFDDFAAYFALRKTLASSPALAAIVKDFHAITGSGASSGNESSATSENFLRSLQQSGARGVAIATMESVLEKCGLFSAEWLTEARKEIRNHAPLSSAMLRLVENFDGLESIIRIRYTLEKIPAGMREAVKRLLDESAPPDEGWIALRKAMINAEVNHRVQKYPHLYLSDAKALGASFERYRELDAAKRALVRDYVLFRWTEVQRARLLAATGNKLNSAGADLKRRLTMRGQNALRLRQVIKVGGDTPGGDPLFDLRPVWMASPATVSQIFPRKALFDLIIFDEASQCRLEEALPVLLRGKRVVIAGDPKQLPPTRFFESAGAASENDAPENEEELFVEQMAATDDLLGAVLDKSVENSYLDVHYRSRNPDLIAFSNDSFYDSRLQAIPGHPRNKPLNAPILLHHVGGVYEKSTNPAEAQYVVKLVKDLLKRSEPPSIGIACFSVSQRDCVTEALDEAAAADSEFASKLTEARNRRGAGSFEGLFVKNLENVQGDERDFMIISTTYGPDKTGRFYRRFGPLITAGGGRRLNVLITRAKDEVHLITSIPKEAYRNLPVIPDGKTPNGGWLLFKYLQFAEQLEAAYAELRRKEEERKASPEGVVTVQKIANPSRFSEALAGQLARIHKYSSTVHWGNEGFCIDIAIHHPDKADDMALGVCCDMSRYAKAEDPVEWEVFRTMVLESQGWKLHRIWTPQFVRDISGSFNAIKEGVEKNIAEEKQS